MKFQSPDPKKRNQPTAGKRPLPAISIRAMAAPAVMFLLFAALLAGCGSPAQSTDDDPYATTEPTVEENTGGDPSATLTAAALENATSIPSEDTPSPSLTEGAGGVSVQTDSTVYQTDQEIVVTAVNGLDSPITTIDQQGFCSIFRIERKEDTEWKELRNCISGPPPQDVTITAGEMVTTTFPPELEPGTYRVGLFYTPGDQFIAGDNIAVYSPPFQVR